MYIKVQNKDYQINLNNFQYENRNSAFRVLTPPMSGSNLCDIVFVPLTGDDIEQKTYKLGSYNNFSEAMGIVNQILQANKDDTKVFVMPDRVVE